MQYAKLTDNPLQKRQDLQRACVDLISPVLHYASEHCSYFDIGDNLARGTRKSTRLESFSRLLWGIGPLMAGGHPFAHIELFLQGLRNGTDPEHPEYWGTSLEANQHQHWIEMAAIGLFMAIAPDQIWDPLDEESKERVRSAMAGRTKGKLPK